jgi:hypothetical protein
MDGVGKGFPPGDFRVSDADRDGALAELSEAFRVGRITADELDQRSGQTLRARTAKELTALLADLPPADPPAIRTTVPESHKHAFSARSVVCACALSLTLLVAAAIRIVLNPGIGRVSGAIAPTAIAVLIVVLAIVWQVIRARRR